MKKIIASFIAAQCLILGSAFADTMTLSTGVGKIALTPEKHERYWSISLDGQPLITIPLSKGSEPAIMRISDKSSQLAILDAGDSVTIAIDPTKASKSCAENQPFIVHIGKDKSSKILPIPTQCDEIYNTSLHDGVFEFKVAYHQKSIKFKDGRFFNDSYVIDADSSIHLKGVLVEKSDKKWTLKLDKAIQVSDGCSYYGVKCLHSINADELSLLSELPESVIKAKEGHKITASGTLLMSSQSEEAVFRLKSITE